jgi:hypothetical protein
MATKSILDEKERVELANNYDRAREIFTVDKLKEILHFTDCDKNPYFDAYDSPYVFDLQAGAKGIGKTFTSGAIPTIYRILTEPYFCSY